MPRSPFPSSLEPGPHLADSQKNGLLTKFLICLIVIASCLMLFPGISQRRYSAGGRLVPPDAIDGNSEEPPRPPLDAV